MQRAWSTRIAIAITMAIAMAIAMAMIALVVGPAQGSPGEDGPWQGTDAGINAPQGSFAAALEAHLQAIRQRDLDALADTVTTGDELILIFPNGSRTDTREEYLDFHRSWFADTGWRMHVELLHVIERPALGLALMKYRYESTTPDGEPRTSINYVAMTFAKEDGAWRLVFDQNTPISSAN